MRKKSRKAFIFKVYIKDGPFKSRRDDSIPKVERKIAILESNLFILLPEL